MFGPTSDSYLELLASLLSNWPFTLASGCIAFSLLYAALRTVPPGIRDRRWFWLVELAVLPLAVTFITAALLALFNLGDGNVWHGRITQAQGVLQILVFAYLADRALTLFVWRGLLGGYAVAVPGIVRNLLAFFVYLIAVYAILAYVFEQPVTGLLVSSGIAVAVLGLAFQSTLSDIVTGVALAIERPFQIGDWIEVEPNVSGRVESIDWRATRLRTMSNTTYVMPNHQIASVAIHNLSRPGPTYSLAIPISVSAEIPPAEVRRILLEAALAAPEIEKTPAPVVRIADAERRPIRYVAFVHCRDYGFYPTVREEFLLHAWRLLESAGAEIGAETQQIEMRRPRAIAFRNHTDALILGTVDLLRPLTPEERDSLRIGGSIHEVPGGTEIIHCGDEGESLFVVLSGIARVFRPTGDETTLELARLSAGSCFGEMSLLTGERRSASVAAHTRVRVLEIPKAVLAPILAQRPEMVEELARIMAERKLANEGIRRAGKGKTFTERLNRTARDLGQRIRKFFGA